MRIGNNIKAIRVKELNLSAQYVADKLGMSIRAYGNIENNVSDISFSKLTIIAEIFKVPIEYFINYETIKYAYQNNFYNQNGGVFTNNITQGIDHQELAELFKKFVTALSEFKQST